MKSRDTVRKRCKALAQWMEQWQQHAPPIKGRRRWWPLAWQVAAVAALGLALALPLSAQAKTFRCSAGDVACLIDAINEANANDEANTIRLAAGAYTLTEADNSTPFEANGLPVITNPLTITGRGAGTTIIERATNAPAFRILQIAPAGTLTLKRLTLRGGDTGPNAEGGGISNSGTVRLTDCTLAHNTAGNGGGISNSGGTMTLTDCTLTDNTVSGSGGAIANTGSLTLTDCTLTDNTAPNNNGGGIYNDGPLTLTNCTLAHNTAHLGSGIYNAIGGTMTLTDCTLAHNTGATGGGGGILNVGRLTLTNCTLTHNTTTNNGGGILNVGRLTLTNCTLTHNTSRAGGGGIANFGSLTLTNCTLAHNTADEVGGGGINGSAILQNTILALNTATNASPQADDCSGAIASLGTNLIGDPTGCDIVLQASDLTGDPGLGDLTDNGRPGNGHLPLLSTSQAIDAGNDAVCPRRDQLGQRRVNIPRVGTSRCDIGAIEFPGKDHRPHKENDDHHDKDHRPHEENEDHHDKDLAAAAWATP